MKMATVRRHALSLAEVTQAPHHAYSSFRVRGRIFVTVPPTEDVIHVFVDEADRERALALYPAWAEKLLWGGKVRGLRITLEAAEAAAVKALVRRAYDVQAAKPGRTSSRDVGSGPRRPLASRRAPGPRGRRRPRLPAGSPGVTVAARRNRP